MYITGAGIFLIRQPQSFFLCTLSKAFSRSKKQNFTSSLYSRMAQGTLTDLEHLRSGSHAAFVLGYTGGVGKALVEELDKAKVFKKVVLVGRREVPLNLGPEFEQKVVDFEKMDEHKEVFTGLDFGFCCLGTTRAKSGKEGFIKVDHDYVIQSAEVAKAQGCKHFSIVSSGGADKNSTFLYQRTKGQVEEELKAMHFDRLSIYRPGLLLCDREESRPAETAARILLSPVSYFFPTALSIPVRTVAKAMVNNTAATINNTGTPINNAGAMINHAGANSNSSSTFEFFYNKTIHQLGGTSNDCAMKRSQSAPERAKPE